MLRTYGRTDGQTEGRTDNQAQTNMLPQPLRSWGQNKDDACKKFLLYSAVAGAGVSVGGVANLLGDLSLLLIARSSPRVSARIPL